MRELLGKGASGDLSDAPLAELIGEAYRRELTGVLSAEHAGGTSRAYVRGGMIVGTQVFTGFKPLGQLLLELGWIDIDGLDRSLMEVARGRKQGEALLELGLINNEQLFQALDIQLHRNLAILLSLSQGRWEWQDEAPPPWTRDLALDPVRLLADEFEADIGPMRSAQALERHLGAQKLVLSRRGVQWLGAEMLEEADLAAHKRLQTPLSVEELAQDTGLSENRARAVAAALLLTGCARGAGEPTGPIAAAPSSSEPEQIVEPVELLEAVGEVGLALSASLSAEVDDTAGQMHEQELRGGAGAAEPLPMSAILVDETARPAEALLKLDVAPAAPARSPEPAPPPPPAAAPTAVNAGGVDNATSHNVRSRLLARAFQNLGMAPRAREPEPAPPPSAPLADTPPASMPGIGRGQKLLPEERLMIQQIEERYEKIFHEDLFQRLHVPRDVTPDALKKAFFDRAMRFHPDRASGALSPLGGKMKEIFTALNEAYDTLSDSHRRAEYLRNMAIKQASGGIDPEKKEAAKSIFQKGQIQLRRRDYHAAEELFHQAAELHPARGNYKAYEAWCILVDPLRPKSDREKVRALLKEALADNRADHAHYVAGVLSRIEEKMVDAETHFRRAVEINEKNIEAVRELKFVRVKLEKDQAGGGSLLDRLRGR